jgi:hypothetical protein
LVKCSGSEVRRHIDGSGCFAGGYVESLGEAVEVLAFELPLERAGDLLVAAAEREQLLFEGVEDGEVVGGEDLALDDKQVDLGLVCEHECKGRVDVEARIS